METYPRHAADEPVRRPRRETSEESVLTVAAPSADNVVTLVQLLEKPCDVCRVVLEIAVHWNDDLSAGVVEPGAECCRLPVVPAELDEPQSRLRSGESRQPGIGLVSTPVVDGDHLPRPAELLESLDGCLAERLDVLLLVVDGDDDRDIRCGTLGGGRSRRDEKWLAS